MASNTRTRPSVVQFAVSRRPEVNSTNLDHHYEQRESLGDLLIEVANMSTTENIVLACAVSADNITFATQQVRVAGTLANTVTVAPGQSMTVTVDGPNAATAARKYWRFRVSDQTKAFGAVTIKHDRGEFSPLKGAFA